MLQLSSSVFTRRFRMYSKAVTAKATKLKGQYSYSSVLDGSAGSILLPGWFISGQESRYLLSRRLGGHRNQYGRRCRLYSILTLISGRRTLQCHSNSLLCWQISCETPTVFLKETCNKKYSEDRGNSVFYKSRFHWHFCLAYRNFPLGVNCRA